MDSRDDSLKRFSLKVRTAYWGHFVLRELQRPHCLPHLLQSQEAQSRLSKAHAIKAHLSFFCHCLSTEIAFVHSECPVCFKSDCCVSLSLRLLSSKYWKHIVDGSILCKWTSLLLVNQQLFSLGLQLDSSVNNCKVQQHFCACCA